MNIKNILKEANYNFKKETKMFLLFAFAFTTIITILFALQNIIENNFINAIITIISIFLIEPLLCSIKYFAIKIIDGNSLEYNDFYFGLKNKFASYYIISSTIIGPFGFFMLGCIVGLFLGSFGLSYYLIIKEPSLINIIMENPTNTDMILEAINNIPNLEIIGMIILAIILILGLVFLSVFSLKRVFSFYIKLDSVFAIENCNIVSEKFYKGNRSKCIGINLILSLMIFIILAISTTFGSILELTKLDAILQTLFTDFVTFFLFALAIMYFNVIVATTYNIYLRESVKRDSKELIDKLKDNHSI